MRRSRQRNALFGSKPSNITIQTSPPAIYRTGPGWRVSSWLVLGNLNDPAIDKDLRLTLEAARPVFHKYFWPEQDRVNRAWIAFVTERVKTIAPKVIPRLEKIYGTKWFSYPVLADASGSATGRVATLLVIRHTPPFQAPILQIRIGQESRRYSTSFHTFWRQR
jgi:hypothetical protein